jgi:GDP-mannose 6-dehydrogenase
MASGKRKVGFLGLSFKPGTDDLRESPLVTLAEQLIGKGLQLTIYDPEVHLSQLIGANRRYIELHLPHIGQLVRGDIESVVAESDLLVVGINSPAVAEALAVHVTDRHQIIDLVGLTMPGRLPAPGLRHGLLRRAPGFRRLRLLRVDSSLRSVFARHRLCLRLLRNSRSGASL